MPIWKAILWNVAQQAAQNPRVRAAAIQLAKRAVPQVARVGQSAIEAVRKAPLPDPKSVAAAVRETLRGKRTR
jgi:hypothetical protein